MKLLLDMNLSPGWQPVLVRRGYECVHWSVVGDPRATDVAIMAWARGNGWTVLTHDLDLGAILAATGAVSPSVVQIRTQNLLPSAMEELLCGVLLRFTSELEAGALVVADQTRARVRILPLG